MPTDLVLIRHGQSFANTESVIAGIRTDRGLTELGRRQAEALGDRLAAEVFPADVLYASTLRRAEQTAVHVAQALGLDPRPDDELQELRCGLADGLTVDAWSQRWPGLREGMQTHPYQPFADEGESWATFLARAGAALTRLVGEHPDQTVVAVCHGGVIEASFYLAFGLGPSVNPVAFWVANTSITRWRFDPDHPQTWRLRGFNDAAHLDRLAEQTAR